MNKITLHQNKPEKNRLAFVKAMKDLTGLGLKESKDICDEINHKFTENKNVHSKVVIDISGVRDKRGSIMDFIGIVSSDCTGDYNIEDISIEREGKLLDIGIGDKIDYINHMSNLIGYLHRDKIVEIFKETLLNLSDDEVKNLYSRLSNSFTY